MRTPRREAGRLINQTVTLRTITLARHPRTGTTASLLPLSTTTELLIINLIPQHDPQPNPPVFARRQLGLSPDPSALICADRTDAVPGPGAPRVPRLHTTESATADYLACSGLPAAVARRWSVPGE